MSDSSRGVGERIVNFCIGALVCAICLTLASNLIKSLWPWLLILSIGAVTVAVYRWRIRRW